MATTTQSFDSASLSSVLVSKGGYNKVDADNAAKGPRAAELAKEFGLSAGSSSPVSTDSSFGSAGDVSNYLGQFQDNLLKTIGDAPQTRIPTAEELKTQLTPATPAPTPISRVETRQQMTTQLGITDLETQLNTIKDEEAKAIEDLRILTGTEEGKPVAMNVIAGRITEEERVAQIRVDAIVRRKNSVINELTTKYNIVDTYVKDLGLDYQDAVEAYDKEFNKNLQVQSMLMDYEKMAQSNYEFRVDTAFKALGDAKDTIKLAEDIKQNNISNARANLSTFVNAISSGNLNPSTLSDEQKMTISKLEAQSGLPSGFVSSLQMNPKDQIMFTSSNNGQTQVGMWNSKTNAIEVKTYGTKTGTTTESQKQKESEALSTATQLLDKNKNSYGNVGPETWQRIRSAWLSDGLPVEEFNKNFMAYTDPNRGDYENAYGIKMTDRKSVQ